jgi:hypothetical protein
MNITFDNKQTTERLDWESGEHSGSITFYPSSHEREVWVQWDDVLPDDWEDIEERIIAAAGEYLAGGTS